MVLSRGIPHQGRIERHRRDHGDDHQGGKVGGPDSELDRRQLAELDQGHQIEVMKMPIIDQRPTTSTAW
jgi:hypothetical protein